MSKQIHPKATPRRRARTPLGLAMLFDALQSSAYRNHYAPSSAHDFADVPTAFLKARDCQAVTLLLKQIADREYAGCEFGPNGDLRASECVDVAVLSAFWAGVATAWHSMTALNGGVR